MKCSSAIRLPAVVLAVTITTNYTLAQSSPGTVWASTGGWAVTERGPNYSVHQKTVVENGTNRVHSYIELSSGLNYFDATAQQWKPSSDQIELLPPGGAFAAAATHGQSQAWFPLDIASGVIQVSGPGGQQLVSRPVALFLQDNKNSVIIAVLTNSIGELVGSNEVVYPNALAGATATEGVTASIRYKYTKSGFEQDVVISQWQLPDPEALGLKAAQARLGVLTAFFGTNDPVATPGLVDAAEGLSDSVLSFDGGKLRMAQGRAFSIGNGEPSAPPAGATAAARLNWLTNAAHQDSSRGTPTFKRWLNLNNGQHRFLMEEIPYKRVKTQLNQLPPATGRLEAASTNLFAANSFLDAIPARLLSRSTPGVPGETRTMRLSRLDLDLTPAVVLDYPISVPPMPGSYTFQSGSTYFVSGMCDLVDVNIQAGTVIKFANVNSCTPVQIGAYNYGTAFLVVEGTLTCQTTANNPAIFTAVDDDTVGEQIENSTHDPSGNYYANPAIYAPYSVSLSNVRIRYAAQALYTGGQYSGNTLTLWNSQVTDCGVMAALGCGYGYDGPITLTCNNCLFSGTGYNGYNYYNGIAVLGYGTAVDTLNFYNCTFDSFYYLLQAYGSYDNSVNAVNCIFADVTDTGGYAQWQGSHNGFYNINNTFGDYQYSAQANPPFTTSGSDNYYLAANPDGSDASGFRNAGTTTIDPNLWAGLRTRTTYASQDGGWPDGDRPDLGYHYYTGVPLNRDSDSDGLPDWWEISWFSTINANSSADPDGDGLNNLQEYQHGTDPTKFDTDGDGLSDSEELTILLDVNNPSLGHLNPLLSDTGSTGIPDGRKDSDHDGISNLGELRNYGSNPSNAHTFNPANNDAEYLFTAKANNSTTKSVFNVTYDYATGLLRFSISGGFANNPYDLYCVNNLAAQRWQWRRVYTGIQCDSIGNAVFEMEPPDYPVDFFQILYAGDADGDGLTDGYEAWFNYNGRHTLIDYQDSDNDGMADGWEVEYGLDPTSSASPNGDNDDPDGDTTVNLGEHNFYFAFDGSYDPLKAYGTPANRPIITVFAGNPSPSCEQSSFTFYRSVGGGGNYNNPLTVYYSVGGSLSYDLGDYTLTSGTPPTPPPDWPRIYSATIPAGEDHVTVAVDAPGVSPNPGDVETLTVSVTPYGVSVVPQVADPYSWAYVVDWQTWNRATITFANSNLRPTAIGQTVQTCPGVLKQITLTGSDSCGAGLTFSVVTEPTHGSLSAIVPINGTSALVTYTCNGSFCGADSFTFKVNDGVRDSAPATVTVNVGDPNLTISPQVMNVMMAKNSATPRTFTFTGSDSCGNILTFAPVSGLGPNHGTLSTIIQIDASHASVSYQPDPNFEGMDGFKIVVNNCGFSSQSPAQVTVFVVAGPLLTTECNSFETGVGVQLAWSLDASAHQMEQQGLNMKDFKIYRSSVSGGPYTLVHTTSNGSQTKYWDNDPNLVAGQTYFYVVTFEYQGSDTTYESPYSNEISAKVQQDDLVAPDEVWDVTYWESPYENDPDNTHNYPINRIHGGLWQAPFGDPSDYASLHPQQPPQPPLVPVNYTHPWQEKDASTGQFIYWSNHITLNLTGYTSQQLAQIQYSIAIDNSYDLYLNSQKIDSVFQIPGIWLPFQPLNKANNLIAGLNEIGVVIYGDGTGGSYFSMVVTGSPCGGP